MTSYHKYNIHHSYSNRFVLYTILFIVLSLRCSRYEETIIQSAYTLLDEIRIDKKQQLTKYLESIRQKAYSVRSDTLLISFFKVKKKYYSLQKQGNIPAQFTCAINNLKKSIQQHYLENYLSFYDILCVDISGEIFYTIRKQADYHQNIFSDTLQNTSLSKHLKTFPRESFVDFQYYDISGEPSAFFVEPVIEKNKITGWLVLQYSINKINNIFSTTDRLGTSGEIILVNKDCYLLTDSRFSSASTILKQRLPAENIMGKYKERQGHKSVVDYRGFKVLSSFEVCSILDSEWLLIVKVNESEVYTDYYKKSSPQLKNTFLHHLENGKGTYSSSSLSQMIKNTCTQPLFQQRKMVEVDVDEFRRVDSSEIIFTHGVSTCTAVIITLPGHFSYLAHLSVLDKQYKGTGSNLVGQILSRIFDFEIFRYELQKLQILIVAPHFYSIESTIDYLVNNGILLSQIKFMNQANARYANIFHDYVTDFTLVEWKATGSNGTLLKQSSEELPSLEDQLKAIVSKSKIDGV